MQKWQRILSSGIIFLLLVIAGAMTVWAADFDDAAELKIGPFTPGLAFDEEFTEGYLSLRQGNSMCPAAGGLPTRNDIHFKKGDISVNEGKFLAMGTSWQSENLLTPRKIGVGSTKEQVLDAYGSPAFTGEKFIRGLGWLPVYTYGSDYQQAGLEFYISKLTGKVVRIRFYSQGLQL
jgi:hypothetical protein